MVAVAWHMPLLVSVCGRCVRHGMGSTGLVCVFVWGVAHVMVFGGTG